MHTTAANRLRSGPLPDELENKRSVRRNAWLVIGNRQDNSLLPTIGADSNKSSARLENRIN
jgi:hypothetical protein